MIKRLTFGQVITALFCGAAVGFMILSFLSAMALPDVWFSHSTGDCVKVLNYNEGDNYSCENLPNRFYHVWVK